jgi:hypothetical protein
MIKMRVSLQEVTMMKYLVPKGQNKRVFPTIAQIIEELDSDLLVNGAEKIEGITPSEKETILAILSQAANDHKFLARLAEDPGKVLKEYDLTLEQRAALASGDVRRIESWIGELDEQMSTWITCRLQQEKW